MVPIPIAFLALFYGSIAAACGATLVNLSRAGETGLALLRPGVWLAASAAVTLGLMWLRPWGRVLALGAAYFMIGVGLSQAAVFITSGRPWVALGATAYAGFQVVVIRYLKRPIIREFFLISGVPSGQPNR